MAPFDHPQQPFNDAVHPTLSDGVLADTPGSALSNPPHQQLTDGGATAPLSSSPPERVSASGGAIAGGTAGTAPQADLEGAADVPLGESSSMHVSGRSADDAEQRAFLVAHMNALHPAQQRPPRLSHSEKLSKHLADATARVSAAREAASHPQGGEGSGAAHRDVEASLLALKSAEALVLEHESAMEMARALAASTASVPSLPSITSRSWGSQGRSLVGRGRGRSSVPAATEAAPPPEGEGALSMEPPSQDEREPSQDDASCDAPDASSPTALGDRINCRLCGVQTLAHAICMADGTRYCNTRWPGQDFSCILQHARSSRQFAISLPPTAPLLAAPLACAFTKANNIFTLGFVKGSPLSPAAPTPLLVCDRTVHDTSGRYCLNLWQPLVSKGALPSWLIPAVRLPKGEPLPELDGFVLQGSSAFATEALAASRLPSLALRYAGKAEFCSTLTDLTAAAAMASKAKDALVEETVTVRWDVGGDGRCCVYFGSPSFSSNGVKERTTITVSLGETDSRDAWKGEGPVFDRQGEFFGVQIKYSTGPLPIDGAGARVTEGFEVAVAWQSVSWDRQQTAVRFFRDVPSSTSAFVGSCVIGHPLSFLCSRIALPSASFVTSLGLNRTQEEALRSSLRNPVSCIQGPPGTGKTKTICALIRCYVGQQDGACLATAQSNQAADNIAVGLIAAAPGLRVLRFYSRRREAPPHMPPSVLFPHHVQQSSLSAEDREAIAALERVRAECGELMGGDVKAYDLLRSKSEQLALEGAHVVVCTCSVAGDKRLSSRAFKYQVMDEATQSTIPEALVPLVNGCEQLTLVGDHKQLGPTRSARHLNACGFYCSMFEQFISRGYPCVTLLEQYRMHPAISAFPSSEFYEGRLLDAVAADRLAPQVSFPWPKEEHPCFMLHVESIEEAGSSGTSCLNRTEARVAVALAELFLKGGADPSSVGILSFYAAQQEYIVGLLGSSGTAGMADVECLSTDSSQGREKDFVILSFVRAGNRRVGFVDEPRRLNVALTRAKHGLVLLGHVPTLSSSPLLSRMMVHLHAHASVLAGPLSSLPALSPFVGSLGAAEGAAEAAVVYQAQSGVSWPRESARVVLVLCHGVSSDPFLLQLDTMVRGICRMADRRYRSEVQGTVEVLLSVFADTHGLSGVAVADIPPYRIGNSLYFFVPVSEREGHPRGSDSLSSRFAAWQRARRDPVSPGEIRSLVRSRWMRGARYFFAPFSSKGKGGKEVGAPQPVAAVAALPELQQSPPPLAHARLPPPPSPPPSPPDSEADDASQPSNDDRTEVMGERCVGCEVAAHLTLLDEQACSDLGMGSKPPHLHCHRCGAVARAEWSSTCPACAESADVETPVSRSSLPPLSSPPPSPPWSPPWSEMADSETEDEPSCVDGEANSKTRRSKRVRGRRIRTNPSEASGAKQEQFELLDVDEAAVATAFSLSTLQFKDAETRLKEYQEKRVAITGAKASIDSKGARENAPIFKARPIQFRIVGVLFVQQFNGQDRVIVAPQGGHCAAFLAVCIGKESPYNALLRVTAPWFAGRACELSIRDRLRVVVHEDKPSAFKWNVSSVDASGRNASLHVAGRACNLGALWCVRLPPDVEFVERLHRGNKLYTHALDSQFTSHMMRPVLQPNSEEPYCPQFAPLSLAGTPIDSQEGVLVPFDKPALFRPGVEQLARVPIVEFLESLSFSNKFLCPPAAALLQSKTAAFTLDALPASAFESADGDDIKCLYEWALAALSLEDATFKSSATPPDAVAIKPPCLDSAVIDSNSCGARAAVHPHALALSECPASRMVDLSNRSYALLVAEAEMFDEIVQGRKTVDSRLHRKVVRELVPETSLIRLLRAGSQLYVWLELGSRTLHAHYAIGDNSAIAVYGEALLPGCSFMDPHDIENRFFKMHTKMTAAQWAAHFEKHGEEAVAVFKFILHASADLVREPDDSCCLNRRDTSGVKAPPHSGEENNADSSDDETDDEKMRQAAEPLGLAPTLNKIPTPTGPSSTAVEPPALPGDSEVPVQPAVASTLAPKTLAALASLPSESQHEALLERLFPLVMQAGGGQVAQVMALLADSDNGQLLAFAESAPLLHQKIAQILAELCESVDASPLPAPHSVSNGSAADSQLDESSPPPKEDSSPLPPAGESSVEPPLLKNWQLGMRIALQPLLQPQGADALQLAIRDASEAIEAGTTANANRDRSALRCFQSALESLWPFVYEPEVTGLLLACVEHHARACMAHHEFANALSSCEDGATVIERCTQPSFLGAGTNARELLSQFEQLAREAAASLLHRRPRSSETTPSSLITEPCPQEDATGTTAVEGSTFVVVDIAAPADWEQETIVEGGLSSFNTGSQAVEPSLFAVVDPQSESLATEVFAVSTAREAHRVTYSNGTRIPVRMLYRWRRIAYLWRGRMVGHFHGQQHSQYWKLANKGALPELYALCDGVRWNVNKQAASRDSLQINKEVHCELSICPSFAPRASSAFIRRSAIPRIWLLPVKTTRCLFGMKAVLGEMATKADIAIGAALTEDVVSFDQQSVKSLLALEPGGGVCFGCGSPGGGAAAAQSVGLPGVIIDHAKNLNDPINHFGNQAVDLPLVTVVKGNALDATVRDKALASNKAITHYIGSLDSPECAPNSTVNKSFNNTDTSARQNLTSTVRVLQRLRTESGQFFIVETTTGSVHVVRQLPGCSAAYVRELDFGTPAPGGHWLVTPDDCPLKLESCLEQHGSFLSQHTCVGASSPILPLGLDSKPSLPCCNGQIVAMFNSGYFGGRTREQLCDLLGIAPSHVTAKPRLNNALPLPLGRWIGGKFGCHALRTRHHIPIVHFDDAARDHLVKEWHAKLHKVLQHSPSLKERLNFGPTFDAIFIIALECADNSIVLAKDDTSASPFLPIIRDIPNDGFSFVHNAVKAFDNSFPSLCQLSGDSHTVRFLCDACGRERPAFYFTVSFAPDDTVTVVTDVSRKLHEQSSAALPLEGLLSLPLPFDNAVGTVSLCMALATDFAEHIDGHDFASLYALALGTSTSWLASNSPISMSLRPRLLALHKLIAFYNKGRNVFHTVETLLDSIEGVSSSSPHSNRIAPFLTSEASTQDEPGQEDLSECSSAEARLQWFKARYGKNGQSLFEIFESERNCQQASPPPPPADPVGDASSLLSSISDGDVHGKPGETSAGDGASSVFNASGDVGEVSRVVAPGGLLDADVSSQFAVVCTAHDCVMARPLTAFDQALSRQYPFACPYTTRWPSASPEIASPDTRSSPGSIKYCSPTDAGQPAFVNFFNRFYATAPRDKCKRGGLNAPPSDTRSDRLRWFEDCLAQLSARCATVESIGFPWMIGCSASEGGDWNEHRALISAFAARHPNIRVSVVQPTSTVFKEALAQVSPALKAGRDALAFAAEERDPDLRAHMMALAVELNALAFEPQASSDGV